MARVRTAGPQIHPPRISFGGGSISWRLPLMVCLLLLGITTVLSWAAYLQVRRSVVQLAEGRLQGVTRELSNLMSASARQMHTRVRALALQGPVRDFLATSGASQRRAAAAALAHTEPGDTTLIAVELLDVNGEPALSVGPAAERVVTPASSELFLAGRRADSSTVGVFRLLGDTLVYPATAIVSAGGRFLGYVVQWRRIGATRSDAESPIERIIGSGALFYLGGGGGAWTDLRGPAPPPPLELSGFDDVTLRYQRPRAGRVIAASHGVAGTPWRVLVEFPERVVMAPVRQVVSRVALVGLIVMLIGLIGTSMLSRRITRPLRQLTDAAAALSGADFSRRVNVTGTDELARLAEAFNVMAERVDDEMAARRRQEDQWRLLFEANPQPMWVYDPDTLRFLAVNDAAVTQYGFSAREFETMTLKDILPPEDVEAVLQEVERTRDQDVTGVRRHRTKDGRVISVEVTAHPLIFGLRRARLVLAQDVTEKLALEQQLRQAQKMEAVGRLAGGVAHDFNNALAVISTYAELLQEPDAPDDARRATYVDSIQKAARHAQSLTRQLLAFSRRQILKPIELDANMAVRGIEQILRRLIGEDIDFATRLAPDVGKVKVDPGQFEQVLLNLAVNARDAMPEGGSLTIATQRIQLDEASGQLHGLRGAGDYVMISVADTGAGMTAETRARIFEPFFTTKEEGKGTGLGLATVYGIVAQSGGEVTVYSEPGHGSTFRVYLPRVTESAEPATPVTTGNGSPKGAETILLVEDDAAVRDMVAEVLDRHGYTVLAAATPAEAISIAQHYSQPLDMVISDVVMPKMNGPTLVAKLRELRPGLKALLMSGYTGDAIPNRALDGQMPFLEKPFTVKGIANKVREILDSGTPG